MAVFVGQKRKDEIERRNKQEEHGYSGKRWRGEENERNVERSSSGGDTEGEAVNRRRGEGRVYWKA